jgi:hypothetical protein
VSVFGHGGASAQAIRDFLAYAYPSWQAPSLGYVLLPGDSSRDPRNFTGLDRGDASARAVDGTGRGDASFAPRLRAITSEGTPTRVRTH